MQGPPLHWKRIRTFRPPSRVEEFQLTRTTEKSSILPHLQQTCRLIHSRTWLTKWGKWINIHTVNLEDWERTSSKFRWFQVAGEIITGAHVAANKFVFSAIRREFVRFIVAVVFSVADVSSADTSVAVTFKMIVSTSQRRRLILAALFVFARSTVNNVVAFLLGWNASLIAFGPFVRLNS